MLQMLCSNSTAQMLFFRDVTSEVFVSALLVVASFSPSCCEI